MPRLKLDIEIKSNQQFAIHAYFASMHNHVRTDDLCRNGRQNHINSTYIHFLHTFWIHAHWHK